MAKTLSAKDMRAMLGLCYGYALETNQYSAKEKADMIQGYIQSHASKIVFQLNKDDALTKEEKVIFCSTVYTTMLQPLHAFLQVIKRLNGFSAFLYSHLIDPHMKCLKELTAQMAVLYALTMSATGAAVKDDKSREHAVNALTNYIIRDIKRRKKGVLIRASLIYGLLAAATAVLLVMTFYNFSRLH